MTDRRYAVIMFKVPDDGTDYDAVEHVVSDLPVGSIPDTWTFEGCDVVENAGQWSTLAPGFD